MNNYNISLTKKLFGTLVWVLTNQISFWVMYTKTGNIVISMAISAAVTIGVTAVLYRLGQIDKKRLSRLSN